MEDATQHRDKIVIFYMLSAIICFLLSLTSETTGSENPKIWMQTCVLLFVLPSWRYLCLLFPRSVQGITWIFLVALLIMGFRELVLSFTPTYGRFLWVWRGPLEELKFIYQFLCPLTLSSSIAAWAVAPFCTGKKIFTAALVMLALLSAHMGILSKNWFCFLQILLLFVMALILHLWKTEREEAYLKTRTNRMTASDKKRCVFVVVLLLLVLILITIF
jgi:hypothetical protein